VASAPVPAVGGSTSFRERVADFERGTLAEALERCQGNKAAAGRLLGLDENQIRYLCRKHALG
jgi:transcriptional regulator with GAF, ATPase, and Fis domain